MMMMIISIFLTHNRILYNLYSDIFLQLIYTYIYIIAIDTKYRVNKYIIIIIKQQHKMDPYQDPFSLFENSNEA
jgi:hypothetical protein